MIKKWQDMWLLSLFLFTSFALIAIGFQCFHCLNQSQVNALCLVRALHRGGDNAIAGDHLVKLAQSDQHGRTVRLRGRHGSRHDYNGCRRTRRHNNQQLTIKHKDLWLALGIWGAIVKTTRRRASPDVSLSRSSPDHAPPEQVIRRRKSTKDWSVVHRGTCAQQVIQSLIYLPRSFQYKILQK